VRSGACGGTNFAFDRNQFIQNQWRIYIEAKEAVLGGPRIQGAPKFIKKMAGE